MVKHYTDTLNRAIAEFGASNQLDMAIEEMSELIKEICKSKRGSDNKEKVCEEIADVYIMLEQLKLIYGLSDDDIGEWVKFKVRRLQGLTKE